MHLSIIIPTLNEAANVVGTLRDLSPMRQAGIEVVLVDGGSTDDTIASAAALADKMVETAQGRAVQMNAGARIAAGDVYWFVHADTRVPRESARYLLDGLASGQVWGRFDIRLSGRSPLLRLVERMMNLRSRLTGIATGDQGIFVTRKAFDAVGGYAEIPLMEDIDLSKRLGSLSRPLCLKSPKLITSSRRWEEKGLVRTILLMWRLRMAYALGADPSRLAREYYP